MKKNVDDLIKEINYEKQKAIENGLIRKEKPQSEISEKDVYCSLPNTWRWIRLGDYCLKATDYVASGSFASIKSNVNYYNTENYALMVKTADFANNFTKNLTYTDESGYKFLSNSNLFGGELILSNIGSIGKIFKVPYLNRPMTLASNTIMIKFTNDELSDYIYYYFKSTYGQNALKSISSGTSMLKFNKTQLKTLPLPIPNLDIQKKIVDALDKAQELIDKRKEQIEQLDELVKSRFIEMFGDPVKNFKGWDIIKLKEITLLANNGLSRRGFNDDGNIVLRLVELQDGYIDYSNPNKIKLTESEENRYLLNDGDFLFARVNGNPDYVGRCAYFKDIGEPVYHNDHIIRVRLNNEVVNNDYLSTILNSSYGKLQIKDKLKTSAGQYTINQNGISEIKIPIPPMELQNQFADFVNQVDKLKFEMVKSLKELEENFNSLMQKAFKGELF